MSLVSTALTDVQRREITRRAERVERDVQETFTHLYQKTDLLAMLHRVKTAAPDARPSLLRALVKLLRSLGVECEDGRDLAYYRALVDALDLPSDSTALNLKVLRTLHSIYRTYPTPEELMDRIVRALSPTAFPGDSTRLLILRRMVAAVNVKENARYFCAALGTDPDALEESAFDALGTPKCPALITAAHNLACGDVSATAATKELLFLFAFAFDMHFYPERFASDYDVTRDVEKNLYEDYYCDNLTRYMSADPRRAAGVLDNEPSGGGLNFKNFVDAAFVYFLNRDDLSAPEKVTCFYRFIRRVKDAWKQEHDFSPEHKRDYLEGRTIDRRELLVRTLPRATEKEFEAMLLEHYFCDVRYHYTDRATGELRVGTRGLFEESFPTNAAFREYTEVRETIESLIDVPSGVLLKDIDLRSLRDTGSERALNELYGTPQGIAYQRISEMVGNVPNLDLFQSEFAEDDAFWAVLRSVTRRLDPYDALAVPSGAAMTRTKLIATYYHYYCLENTADGFGGNGDDSWMSFKALFDDFCFCINTYLVAAGYQPISVKNVFDMLVVLFAYCTVNALLTEEGRE